MEQSGDGVDVEFKLPSSGAEDGERSSTAKDGGNSVRDSGDVKTSAADPAEAAAVAQVARHAAENNQSVQHPHPVGPSKISRPSQTGTTSLQGPTSLTARPVSATQLPVYDLYHLEDVNTLLAIYAAEINKFYATYEAGILVGYAAWNNDDAKVDFVRMICHEWENLDRQRDLLQNRAEIPRAVSWPDLVDRKVRMPFVKPRGPKVGVDEYIMDVEKTTGMPDGVWQAFDAMFKTHTFEGAKLGGYYLLEQIKEVKRSPLHYQECGVWGGEEKSWFLTDIEAKIQELEYVVGRLTLEGMRAVDIPKLVKVVQPKLVNGGHASQSTTTGISDAPSARKESASSTKTSSTYAEAGEVVANEKPEGREPNVRPKPVNLSSANAIPVAARIRKETDPATAKVLSTPIEAGNVAASKEPEPHKRITELKRQASPPPNAPTGPRAWKRQRTE